MGQSNPSSALPSPLLLFCFLCKAMDILSAERRTTASGPEGLRSAQHLRGVPHKLDEKDRVERLEYPTGPSPFMPLSTWHSLGEIEMQIRES